MEQQTLNQLFRPYVPVTLRDALDAGALRAGQVQTYQATILHTDLKGFTRLTALFATLPDGAEQLHNILNRYFEVIIATITANGGDVIHIAGDALTAWWPDITDPALAMRCGYVLHNALTTLNPISTPEGPFTLELRVGISVGTVYLTLVGIPNQGIHPILIGSPINAASLAEQQANPGQVQFLLINTQPTPTIDYYPSEAPILRWEHFLPPSFARRLQLNTLVAEYRRCVPVFAAFDLPAYPVDLQALVTQAQAITMRWGGWLNEIELGSKGAVMVFLFGAPVAHGDDTSRAVGCAIELRNRGVIRKAGITVGTLFVGEVGGRLRRVYTAQGEEMNLAALLMDQAPTGAIVVSGRVRQDIMGRYRTTQPQLVPIKGYNQPIPTALVLSEPTLATQQALQASLGAYTELIGREQERQMIDRLIANAPRQGQVLLIEGEAGIGKSSLIHHLSIKWLERRYHSFRGECQSGMQEQPLHPWRFILGELCGIDDSTPLQARYERLQQMTTELSSALPNHIATLAHLLNIDGFVHARRSTDISPLVIELLINRLKREPLLIILEDIHWADPASLQLLNAIIEAVLPHLPLLIVVSYRPLANHVTPIIESIRRQPFTTHHLLERLPAAERIHLIRQLIGVKEIDTPLLQYLERYAAGQPFFIKEYVHILLQKRLITIEQDTARLHEPIPSLQLSSQALGIVQARIDQMGERTRLTLKIAAVIGRSFPLRLLQHIHPAHLTEDELHQDIAALVRDQLIELEMNEPEPIYRFIFGIAHEAAYHSLLFTQRRDLHQAAYTWYLTKYQNELTQMKAPLAVYDVMIHHSLRAEMWANAVEHCWQAALICVQRSLFQTALHYIEKGIAPNYTSSRRAELLVLRIILNDRIGDHLHQAEDFHLFKGILPEQEQPVLHALASVLYLHHMLVSGQFDHFATQRISTQRQIDRLSQNDARAGRLLQAGLWLVNAQYLALQGQYKQAMAMLHRINRIGKTVPRHTSPQPMLIDLIAMESLSAQSYELQGWILIESDNFQRAQKRFQQAIRLARMVNDQIIENRSQIGLYYTMIMLGQYDGIDHRLQQALHMAQSIGDRYSQVLGLRTQAVLHFNRHNITAARQLIWQAIALAHSSQIAVLEIVLLNQLEKLARAMQ